MTKMKVAEADSSDKYALAIVEPCAADWGRSALFLVLHKCRDYDHIPAMGRSACIVGQLVPATAISDQHSGLLYSLWGRLVFLLGAAL